MTTTSLNQNSKTTQDIPWQFCSFPRTSQYEIQGHFQDKGSFLELFLGKSWTNLLLLSKNKFLLCLCYCSHLYYFVFLFLAQKSNIVGWLVTHNKIKSTKMVVDISFFLKLKISNKRKNTTSKNVGHHWVKFCSILEHQYHYHSYDNTINLKKNPHHRTK